MFKAIGQPMAKYYGLAEVADEAFYQLHRIPYEVIDKTLWLPKYAYRKAKSLLGYNVPTEKIRGWSKYTYGKLNTIVGKLLLATYAGAGIAYVTVGGTEEVMSIEQKIILANVISVTVSHACIWYKRKKEVYRAEALENYLKRQLQGDATIIQEEKQRNRQINAALGYLASIPMWAAVTWAFSKVGNIDLTDPAIWVNVGAITLETLCLHGHRYILTIKDKKTLESLIEDSTGGK